MYDSVDEIDLAVLPDKFVLKPNHSSGKVLICRDKRKINWIKAADIMRNWLRENYYDLTGEWGYKDIPPKIMCEKLLQGEIIDYKFFCFDGIPIIANVIGDRKEGGYHEIWVDLDFESLLLTQNSRGFSSRITKPEHWEKMIQIAQILSKEFPFVRVDLYDLGGQVYFGELTFTPANGMDEGLSLAIDRDLGKRYDTLRWDIKK